ncbi:MAG TPA: cytochrome c biogenesis heme-transporting ATPase CcmA [Steroidobacteraceae bacterium]|nr:cytochrome c biogenesis heme-transporting ATPase CcmA [Steroidobacteraceae bacterium]
MLKVENLHLWRGERHVLRGVGFRLEPGELLHVAGANGAGKTTLLRTVAGLVQPEQGEVYWRNKLAHSLDSGYAEQLAYVAHDAALKSDLTAYENLVFMVGLRHAVADSAIGLTLAKLGVAHCANLPARALSAGQRRRVALARLLLSEAVLWILDEPLTNLDAAGGTLVLGLLDEHLAAGGLALVATHGELAIRSDRARRLELT